MSCLIVQQVARSLGIIHVGTEGGMFAVHTVVAKNQSERLKARWLSVIQPGVTVILKKINAVQLGRDAYNCTSLAFVLNDETEIEQVSITDPYK